MTETREHRLSAAPAGAAAAARGDAAAMWQGGWAVAVVAGAAAMLVALGGIAGATATSLFLGAAPGVLGYVWRPKGGQRLLLIVVWAVAAALAASLSGGATGPLAAWCLAPLLVGALLGLVPPGALLAALAVLAAAAMEWAGAGRSPESGAAAVVLSAVGLLVLFGGVAGAVVLTSRDVRRRAEALRTEQGWFEEALSALPHLGAALEPNGVPEAVFGAAPQGLASDWLAKGVVEAASPPDRGAVGTALRNALEQGEAEAVFRPAAAPDRTFRVALRRRGDRGLSALVHEAPPHVELPADARVEAAERRVAEAEAARADAEAAAAAKSRFLANMSHELRTPLNAIMGFSDIMRARMFGELSPKYGEYAELIHESGRHLTDLINDVLDMSKIEAERYSLTLETFDARDAINASMRLMRLQADEARIQLRGLMPPEAIAVEADRRALKQIVLNLVSNALKFTPPGGSVTVTARARGGELEVVVADTGAGIAPEDLERLGRPYEQAGDADRRAQGTGLGLSLVKAFAGLHGGAMSIESAPGEGTAVTVRMPVIAGWVEVERAPEPDPASDAVPIPSAEDAAEALLETAPVDGAQVLEAEIEDRTAEMEPLEPQPHDALRPDPATAAESDLEAEMAQEPGAEAAFEVEAAPEPRPAPQPRPQPEAANEAGEPPNTGGVVIHLPGARPV